jgi:dihydroflavonol-4-reductase
MKVLITGGSGFLGGWVTKLLAEHGHAVATLSRKPKPRKGVETIAADISNRAQLARAMRGRDAVVHVAGMVSLKPAAREELLEVNVEGTRNVLEAAAQQGVRVVHTSSIATLGYTETAKIRDETSALAPEDRIRYAYAGSKWQAERLALDYAAQDLDVVVVNPGYLLGPGDIGLTSTRLLLEYIRGDLWLYPPGGISFADVRDVACAMVAAVVHGRSGNRYALAGENLLYAALFEQLHQLTGGRRLMPAPGGVGIFGALAAQLAGVFVPHPFQDLNLVSWQYACRYNFCDCTKAASELGYRRRPFVETMRDTVGDFLARGVIPPTTPELTALRAAVPHASDSP